MGGVATQKTRCFIVKMVRCVRLKEQTSIMIGTEKHSNIRKGIENT